MMNFVSFVLGVFMGFVLLSVIFKPLAHSTHVRDYKICLELGAPQQNCFDRYLVEKKP